MKITRRFHYANTKHGYHVEVLTAEGNIETWDVWANNRSEVNNTVKKEKATVRSVNMYG